MVCSVHAETESARGRAGGTRFCGWPFMGRFNLPQINPFPARRLETFLNEHVDPDEIDRTGEIPQEVIDGLAQMGAFGIKVSPQYGGLGLSQTNYCRAGIMLGSYCGNLTALISAHQSIGVPQPLILFGTEEQKRGFCPELQAARYPRSRSLR
jgi:alkylation response protein AidB-like acyl-CoA dehydrogenase